MKDILSLINRTYEQGISDAMLWMFARSCPNCQSEIADYLAGVCGRRAFTLDQQINLLSPVDPALKAALVRALADHKDGPVSQPQP